jgi:hypothetical protein
MGDEWPWAPPTYVTWQDVFTEMNSLGQSQQNCAVWAAIGQAESSEDLTVLNNTPSTGDLSVGIFQINYYGSLSASRTAAFGTPQQLATGGLTRQCLAAIRVGGGSFAPWSTFKSGAYLAYLHGAAPPAGGGSSGAPPTVQQGSTGPFVSTLQQDLNKLGYSLAVDGSFGPLTRAAVVSFQSGAHISVDGIVGPQTWQALANAIAYAEGGAQVGPTNINTPPSEAAGNIDGTTVATWGSLVSASQAGMAAPLNTIDTAINIAGGL